MPDERINVYFTITDDGSKVLASISDKTKSLDKDTQRLSQSYAALKKANEPLLKQQVELENQLASSKKTVRDAEKAFKKLGDAASEDAFTKAKEQQQELQGALKDTKGMIQENERAYKSNLDTIRKSSGGINDPNSLSRIGFGLAASGVGSQFASAAGGYLQARIASRVGMPEASMISDTISGAISGAAMGSIIPGIGTAVGAVVGAGAGLLQARTQIFEAKDDAFKDYYAGLYETTRDATAEGISAGSTIAAGREKDKISFTTLFKDESTAADFLGGLVDMANYTPFLYDDLTAMSKTLATYGFKPNLKAGEEGFDILDTLQTVGDAGAALGMATSDMNAVSTALGRMLSSNKTSLEYLNILNDRGIGAVGMLAEAKGMSVGDTYDAISKGTIAGSDAVGIILSAMEKAYPIHAGTEPDLCGHEFHSGGPDAGDPERWRRGIQLPAEKGVPGGYRRIRRLLGQCPGEGQRPGR